MSLAQQLHDVLDARPLDSLGAHPLKDQWLIRAFVPGADKIEVQSVANQKALGQMTLVDPLGLFELLLPVKEKPLYQLHIHQGDAEWTAIDPYQFGERAMADLPCNSDTLYKNMGAQLCSVETEAGEIKGVRFAVYAPNARSVSVIGAFNSWDGRRHPMQSHSDGIWRLFVPGLQAGDTYKFELKDSREHRLPHKSDPYQFYGGQHPDFHSIVFDHNAYQWNDAAWQKRIVKPPTQQPISIYEMHAGSWQHHDGRVLNYRELADRLVPYLQDMQFTHVEFLPVNEHPFDGSWGYQPLGLFSPTSRFGSPDDFKYLVDQCHQAGIGVIVDWVPGHFPADEHGLAQFDGSALYEYEDPRRGWHPDWNSYIYDFGRYTVRDFLISSALIWLDYFHVDGIRVDAVASMLYLDYSREEGEWVPNVDGGNHNYEAIDFLKRFNTTLYREFPKAMSIAEESTAYDGVSRPVDAGGLGFGFKWNMGWMHDTLNYMQRDPVHRRYHHGDMTFSMVYAYNENFVLPLSHDEVVHGKGSILTRMPGDDWQQAANLRAYYGFMFGHPGKKLNFMGNEIAQSAEWNHQSQLDWWLLEHDRHRGTQQLFKDLNKLYRNEPALHEKDCDPSGFRWIHHEDAEGSVFSFIRSADNGDVIVVISNMTPSPHPHYRLGVPVAGRYRVILNTDSHFYGGSNYDVGEVVHSLDESAHGLPFSIDVRIPPMATVFLKTGPVPIG